MAAQGQKLQPGDERSGSRLWHTARLLEREIDEEALGFLQDRDEIHLDIDEHSFSSQELAHTVTEVKQRKVVEILRDDRIATLKKFLTKIPSDKVKEV